MQKYKLYLAGPMRQIKDFNFPSFHAAAARLRAIGYEVFNPAEHDERKHGQGFAKSDTGDPKDIAHTGFDLRATLVEDLAWIAKEAHGVAVLPGYEQSKGATAEVALARAIGIPVLAECDWPMAPVLDGQVGPVFWDGIQADSRGKYVPPEKRPSSEVRVTDSQTGGQKGVKLERFDLIPAEPLEELARVYGRGAAKYSCHNWAKGYNWSLSFGAMMRHAWKFWAGEEKDELGNPHMACVAWHAMTLLWFSKHRQSHDDRLTEKGPRA